MSIREGQREREGERKSERMTNKDIDKEIRVRETTASLPLLFFFFY